MRNVDEIKTTKPPPPYWALHKYYAESTYVKVQTIHHVK
jgi:hypothetical protein